MVLLAAVCPEALAQASFARISGRVADQFDAALPGVTITVTLGELRRQSLSDGQGRLELSELPPGRYTLTATLLGFRTETRLVDLVASATTSVDIALRIGCVQLSVSISSHPPLIDPQLPARSDLVAQLRIDERFDWDSPADLDCRIRYRATVLQEVTRRSYRGPIGGTIEVFLKPSTEIELGKEYIVWLTWRQDKNAFDSGRDAERLVMPIENGQVKTPGKSCFDTQGGFRCNYRDTYSVDDLFTIFDAVFGR